MIEYMKQKIILDFNFVIDYWWFYGIVVLMVAFLVAWNNNKSQ
jgi:hypothetical protein